MSNSLDHQSHCSSKHKIRSLCIKLLAFQSKPIIMFHQGICQSGKALKEAHMSYLERITQLQYNITHLYWESRILVKHKIRN